MKPWELNPDSVRLTPKRVEALRSLQAGQKYPYSFIYGQARCGMFRDGLLEYAGDEDGVSMMSLTSFGERVQHELSVRVDEQGSE